MFENIDIILLLAFCTEATLTLPVHIVYVQCIPSIYIER